MRKKYLTKKLFIALFTLCILAVSSVMPISAWAAVVVTASAESDKISVVYQFDESEILNWLDTKQFMKNLRVQSMAGEPLTPYKVANILLPPCTEVAHVSVVGKVGGQHIVKDIPCGQPPAVIGEEPKIVGKNPDIYNLDRLYPYEIYRVGSVESFRGYNILQVQLYPLQYKPASRLALYYKEITVQVKLREGSKMNTLRNSAEDRETVTKLVDNPLTLATYDSTLASLNNFNQTYKYLIITTAPLASAFQVLADWKAHFVDGAKVHIVDASATDQDVKDVINHYYTYHGTSYVLLGGDVDVLPYHTKRCIARGGHTVDIADIAEDYWFANLDGDEEISYYEVYIGRAPVDNSTEATNFVNKVIAYEQMPKPKANLFHESRTDTGNVPDARRLAWQCEQYVPQDYTSYELFEENGRIEKTDWINFWRNDGIMCEHEGHGSEDSYLINYEVGGGRVEWYNTDVDSLDNTFWPVHTSVACHSGAFEYKLEDCLAEAYVKDRDNGAIACLFNDNYGWYMWNDTTMYSGDFIEMQFKGLYQEGYENIGAMLAYSKHCFIEEATAISPYQEVWEWCWREINLIGDPETPLLTTREQLVNVIKNSGWETGNNSFWDVSTTKAPNSVVYYEVNQNSACFGTYGFHVAMETSSNKPLYTTQSLMEYQYLSKAMLDTNTKLRYTIYPAYELHGVSEVPRARWEIILFFSTGNKLHYYGSLNMAPTDNSTDKYVSIPINLSQWNEFHDNSLLQTYASKFGIPPIGTAITKIAAYVTSQTYAVRKNQFNRVIANFDSDEHFGGLLCTPWYIKNVDTGLNYETIQEAINAPETLAGHTISIQGKYPEHVVVNKPLTLKGTNPNAAIIDGSGTGKVVTVQVNNSIISRLRIQNGDYGVYIEYGNNDIISNNDLSAAGTFGIYLDHSDNNTVVDNTAKDWLVAIYMYYSNQNTVRNNTLSYCTSEGIFLYCSSNNFISGNTITNNEDSGIDLYICHNNVFSDNTISNNGDDGIFVDGNNNSICNNILSSNVDTGIFVYWFSNNTISGNTISENNYGVYMHYSSNVIYHNNFINNTVQAASPGVINVWDDGYPSGGNYWSNYNGADANDDGIGDTAYQIDANNTDRYPLIHSWGSIRNIDTNKIYLTIQKAVNAPETLAGHKIEVKTGTYYEHVVVNKSLTLRGENPSTTILDGGSAWDSPGFLVNANDTTITGFTVRNCEKGIDLWGFNGNVSGNKFDYSCSYAIYLNSKNNIISNNDLSALGGSYGIYLDQSNNNTIVGNTVQNKFIGIYMYYSNYNTIRNNTLSYCTVGRIPAHSGIYLIVSNSNVISGNAITNNEDYGIALLYGSNSNVISCNTISNNDLGIDLYGSQNTVSRNMITNNVFGINVLRNDNVISGNMISQNNYGVYVQDDNNVIYNNNFINNTVQAYVSPGKTNVWDDGFPSGGNYWSNYVDVDQYSGPYQDEAGSDGIWDHPYNVASNNLDNYPLAQPWKLVKNVNTNLTYSTIQEAIDAPETLDGHTIKVYVGIYYEQVIVRKSLTLKGIHPSTTILDGGSWLLATGFVVCANDTTITGFTVRNYYYGVDLWGYNSNISDNRFTDCKAFYGAAVSVCSNNNIIGGNKFYNNEYSIYLYSSNNIIRNNLIELGRGISLNHSNNNTIVDNTVKCMWSAVGFKYSNQNTVRNNTISSTFSSGINLEYSNNNVISGNIVSINRYYDGIYLYYSLSNVISGNTVSNNDDGIYLWYSSNNTISGNTISNNDCGTRLKYSSNNVISGNTVSNSGYEGIIVDGSNASISNNIVSNNGREGISVDGGNSFISNNIVTNNSYYGNYGIYVMGNNTFMSNNTVSNNRYHGIYVYGNNALITNNTVSNNRYHGILLYGNNASITNNIASDNGYDGIEVDGDNNTISGNTISNNQYGIELWSSSSTTISGNTISKNKYGVYVRPYAQNNAIYHNNFINNTLQAYVSPGTINVWDNGYPSGGNYWSNYTDIDQCHGPGQNKTGGDGIWDHPYTITSNNTDRYPLKNPWPTHNIAVTDVTATPTEVLRGDSVSVIVTVINQGDFSETFNVTVYYDNNVIGTQVVIDLSSRDSKIVIFPWDTSGVNPGVYTIKAVASVVVNEIDTADNTKIDGTVSVKAWDLLDEPWNQLDGWASEGKGTSTIATLQGKSCLYNKPNRGTYITRKKDIGTLPETGYTVETSLYVNSWGTGGTNAFVAFKFYDGMHLVTIEIHSDRVVGPQNQFNLTTQIQSWYTWRFVIDSDAHTIYVYRDKQYVGTLTGLTDSTANDGLVYCSWTQNPTGYSGCESYTDYIKIATGLYTPS